MRFIVYFSQNYFLKIISNLILLAYFWSYLTKNATNNIAQGINLDLDIVFKFEIVKDQGFDKHLSQLNKSLPSIKS